MVVDREGGGAAGQQGRLRKGNGRGGESPLDRSPLRDTGDGSDSVSRVWAGAARPQATYRCRTG